MKHKVFLTLTLPLICGLAVPLHAAPATIAQTDLTAQNSARAALTQGVNQVVSPGLPGIVATISDNAFPVVAGKTGKTSRESVMAAALKGQTRIVAFGHDGYLLPDNLKVGDTNRLLDNAMMWAAGGQKPARVGVIAAPKTFAMLKARGYNAVAIKSSELDTIAVAVVNGHDLKDTDFAPMQAFLARGGGLIIATTGWGWNWTDNSKTLAQDFIGNRLLAPYGLVWTMGTLDKTSDIGFAVEPVTPLANAQNALALLQGDAPIDAAQSEQVSSVLGNAMTGLPASDTQLLPKLKQIAAGATGDIVPFERAPIKADNPKARLMLTIQSNLEKTLPMESLKPHPAGAIFPGDVPPNAKPRSKSVAVDTRVPQWHSTGLYAAPGVPVIVNLPANLNGYSVRIGSHTDTLYHLDSWKRAPDISRSFALKAGENKIVNPFGGLVYVVVPEAATAGTINVEVKGAFAAPLYVKGQTSLADWKNTIRWSPSPWAEIASDKLIVTVPSRAVRDLDDPAALMDFYDQGMDAAADLYGISRNRTRPERIVADVQISAGYMHSGYPIMTWLNVEKTTVDVDQLKKFPWGHWHEMGHNHQKGDWTFGGTGEVTNNLLPVYVWTQLLKQPLNTSHPALKDADRAARWAKYDAGGRQFSEWQSDPWLALEMYLQMEKAFGWEPFKQVFSEYGGLTDAQRPKTEEQKHDQWMTRMARATGKNLGPFFEKWNVPTSAAARKSIADLPAWMPEFPA